MTTTRPSPAVPLGGKTGPGDHVDRASIEASFRASMTRLRARVRQALFIEGLALLSWSFLAYFVFTLVFDKFFRLEQPVRVFVLAAALAWVLVRFYRQVFVPFTTTLSDHELALAVERSRPGMGQKLISALEFLEAMRANRTYGASRELMMCSVDELAQLLPTLDFGTTLVKDRVRQNNRVAAVCVSAIVAIAFIYPGFSTWAWRNVLLSSTVEWPRYVNIQVIGAKDGELVLPRGDDITVEVAVSVSEDVPEEERKDYMPDRVQLSYWFVGGGSGTETMVQNTGENTFSYTFPSLLQSVEFEASGGDGLSRLIKVRLVDRPLLEEQKLTLHYPDYMQRKPRVVDPEVLDLLLPKGAVLEVDAKANKHLVAAWLSLGDKQQTKAEIGDDQQSLHGQLAPEATGLFHVRLKDEYGLGEGNVQKLLVKVVPDKAPKVGIRLRGIGAKITPQAMIPMDLNVRDDFGLSEIGMFWGAGASAGIGGGNDVGKDFKKGRASGLDEFEPGMEEFQRRIRFDLLPMLVDGQDLSSLKNPVRPGMFLSIRLKAWDNHRADGAQKGQWAVSESYTFKVVEPTELLAELIRRQREQRLEFEKYVNDHKRDMGDFNSLDDPRAGGDRGRRIKGKISSLARHERYLARSVKTIGVRYAEIIDEMRNNRLEKVGTLNKLKSHIVDPLEELSSNWMPDLARRVAQFGRSGAQNEKEEASKLYDEVYRRMMRVLNQMKKLESFTEILSRLKEVIRLEDDAKKATEKKLKESLEDLFGEDEPKKSDKKKN